MSTETTRAGARCECCAGPANCPAWAPTVDQNGRPAYEHPIPGTRTTITVARTSAPARWERIHRARTGTAPNYHAEPMTRYRLDRLELGNRAAAELEPTHEGNTR